MNGKTETLPEKEKGKEEKFAERIEYCKRLEQRIIDLEEEGKRMREELRGLRDQLEEEAFGRKMLEKKVEEKLVVSEDTLG